MVGLAHAGKDPAKLNHMNTIGQVLTWPHDAIVEALQVKIDKVFPGKTTTTGKFVQNIVLKDVAGNTIKASVWEHSDLTSLQGKEVILHSNRGGNGKIGGVKVSHNSYVAQKDGKNHKAGDTVNSVDLSISKLGTFQFVEVYRQQNPASSAQPTAEAAQPAVTQTTASAGANTGPCTSRPIHGATVGSAVNNACALLIARGEDLDPVKIKKIAVGIIKVAIEMESGDLSLPAQVPDEDKPF